MSLIQALVLGILEGVTEFLPVSSTAHLIIGSRILRLSQTPYLTFFQIVIQSGAILAVLLLYKDLFMKHRDLLMKVALAFLPTAIIGIGMRSTVTEVFFQSNLLIGWSLTGVGFLFILMELLIQKQHIRLTKTIEKMTLTEALLIGLVQSVAIIPGISRAGAVMVGMMGMKYKRSEAALFSFLLAVPTILGAGLAQASTMDLSVVQAGGYINLIVGASMAFVSAYIFIKWFIHYLQNHTLHIFAFYRILLGTIILISLL
jgi:undecaprenyl-diphosphatase